MNTFLRGVLAASAVVAMSACSYFEKEAEMVDIKTIEGNVFYLQRIALPPTAELIVSLEDVSLADAPAKVLSAQTYSTDGKQVPLPFTLDVPAEGVNAKGRYTVRATIEDEGKKLFVTDSNLPVLTDENKTSKVEIKLVSAN